MFPLGTISAPKQIRDVETSENAASTARRTATGHWSDDFLVIAVVSTITIRHDPNRTTTCTTTCTRTTDPGRTTDPTTCARAHAAHSTGAANTHGWLRLGATVSDFGRSAPRSLRPAQTPHHSSTWPNSPSTAYVSSRVCFISPCSCSCGSNRAGRWGRLRRRGVCKDRHGYRTRP